MHNGRIAYFEDHVGLADLTQNLIETFGEGRHQVVARAADLGGALAVLDQIASGEVEANVIMSDGSLSRGTAGSDARTIMGRVEALGLNVKTILMSNQSAEAIGVAVDVDLPKGDATGPKLVEVLDSLPELES
jgi:hypothetical protein